jgi:hypothetical protein
VFDYIQKSSEEVANSVICGGLKVAIIPVLYGIIIYLISLVVRVMQKPRL